MFKFKSQDYDTYIATRPKVVVPIPLDLQNGPESLNFKQYQKDLYVNSNVYLDCPIWRQPLQPKYQSMYNHYSNRILNNYFGSIRIIREDTKELTTQLINTNK